MIYPSEKEFLRLSRQGNLIPIYQEILGDMDTPVSAYYKMAAKSKYAFLLESVEGEAKVAQFSFLAQDPECVIRSKGQKLEILDFTFKSGPRSKVVPITDSPLRHIRDLLSQYKFVKIPGLPRFCGGLVGYIGYDLIRFYEKLEQKPLDDLGLPDTLLVLAKSLMIFDHLNHKIKVVHCVHVTPGSSRQQKTASYRSAVDKITHLSTQLQQPLDRREKRKSTPGKPLKAVSNMTEKEFCRSVEEAKKRIRAGDIIQVVLSQRFSVNLTCEPFQVYRMLRALNPSPYMYYLHLDDIQIVGSSPELLVRCEDGVVDTRPIAGTRPRGRTDEEDAANAKDLLNDPKEKAEHIMLVDLGRNDLGRVCRKGSVQLSEFMAIEKYSHVMHIVSNVRGRLQAGRDAFDVLAAAFPAGTVSGAPKIRAMEIIDDLENVARGPYAGCIGYFSFSGNLDSCITIRTIIIKDDKAYIQAGAGIVADSQPKKEYVETMNKARAQILALEKADQTFDNNA